LEANRVDGKLNYGDHAIDVGDDTSKIGGDNVAEVV
jgi:hypothetical protein